ncbi:hypothetical protein [Octadecabacter antarcticus]|uniref:hypothetical protein n=1 Tax=Octadecabacter antarcticus TaxID=1217908 RepID=UPI001650DF7C|nr:hypothetical protein [Octadecabacter antarcticus]
MAQNNLTEVNSKDRVEVDIVKRNRKLEHEQLVITISKQAASTRLHLAGRFKMN